ncbi:MAG: sodium-translocating pyrophosphatase [Chloroflexi bacterium RBG_13_53_26]|nr:MAG: sodium-translocating pyrophosphatase [Chloroflexi bacterium RBG_13_53_26]
MDYMFIALIAGVLGLAFAVFSALYVLKQSEGTDRMKEISAAIKEGALAFLRREYQILAVFVIAVTIILSVIPDLGWRVGLSFIFGAICSMGAGYAGMSMAIRSNARTAAAAQTSLNQGLRVSFRAGAVMGMTVVGVGLIGLGILYFAFHNDANFLEIIPAYGFGASGVALFSRVGGGIYTKAADTGADLVGKVEKGIPEDDPRNAAVIADFVGDNVGDVAGMGADLFESYVESIIAVMALSMVAVPILAADAATAWLLPMMIAAGGVVASIIGALLVRVGETPKMEALLGALRRGVFSASILTAIFAFLVIYFLGEEIDLYWAVLAGLVAGVLIGESTNYFTSFAYNPTKAISKSSMSGAGANIVNGFANGLLSIAPPFIFVVAALLVAYHFASFYGVALAGIGMLSTLGITLATDAYGPVADNSGGIVEMSHLPKEIRERTDALDSLGNTTAATGKGFAIGSAALTALALLLSYAVATDIVQVDAATMGVSFDPSIVDEISLLNAPMIAGLFLGVMLPGIFCALALTAVGKTTGLIVDEVRRQFREIKGIMDGTGKPEYGKCVDICTRAALRQMILPAMLAITVPLLVGFVLGKFALLGFLMGSTASGFLLAVAMANAGGAWDNAKKYIESGQHGGKGSDAHKAAVVGDTVGDPMKDTAGPSLNIMIKLMAVISLVFAPVIINWEGYF